MAERFGWYPSRRWGSEPPPEEEIRAWGLFNPPPQSQCPLGPPPHGGCIP